MEPEYLSSDLSSMSKNRNLYPDITKLVNGSIPHHNDSYPDNPDDFKHTPLYIFVFVTILNIVIFCVGIFGNTLVILVVCRVRAMRNPTNYFLFTLSIGDLFVLLICQPVALMEFYGRDIWYLGEAMCKLVPLLEHGMVHVSILMMMGVTTERFYAILYPFKKQASCSDKLTIKLIIVLWIFAYLWTSPFLFLTHLVTDAIFWDGSVVSVCRSFIELTWHKAFIVASIVVFFVLPCFVIVYMYSQIIRQLTSDSLRIMTNNDKSAKLTLRSRKQVVKMLIFIIVLFFLCMCPINVVSLWQIFTPVEHLEKLGIEAYFNIIWFARIMMYINSAGNPVIYSLTSSKFKAAFKRLLNRRNHCYRRYEITRGSSDTTQVFFRKSKKRLEGESVLLNEIKHRNKSENPTCEKGNANKTELQIRLSDISENHLDIH